MSTPNMAAGTDRSSHRFRDSETQFPVMTFQCLGAVLGLRLTVKKKNIYIYINIRVFPKIMVAPNHPILIGFSIIFTIHFGVPLFLETSI